MAARASGLAHLPAFVPFVPGPGLKRSSPLRGSRRVLHRLSLCINGCWKVQSES